MLALGAGLLVAGGATAGTVPGALGLPYDYSDAYTGWPVAPVHEQHPIRGSFLDPRFTATAANYHIGLDIGVRDDQPEAGAPSGRTHRVYAIEGGTVEIAANVAKLGCINRRVNVAHFEYWHTDPVGTLTNGDTVVPGQFLGWTCKGNWHVHLSERMLVGGTWVYVDPIHPGVKLAPFADSDPPEIGAVRFYTPAPFVWGSGAVDSGSELAAGSLGGTVDARVQVADPQSFFGFFTDISSLYADWHPYRLAFTLARAEDGKVVLGRDVYRADGYLGQPSATTSVPIGNHYAPGTTQNKAASACLASPGSPCTGKYVLRLFGTAGSAYLQTAAYANGPYHLDVTAWDESGQNDVASVDVTLRNPVLRIAQAGSGTVTRSSVGYSCGTGCWRYARGARVTLTATPASSSTFTGWSGACSGKSTCALILNADTAAKATFAPAP